MNTIAPLYMGTSGLVLPVPNKLFFPEEYQDKSRLSYYASLFNSLEVNSSFYKIPRAATVARWADSVPDAFRFTFKLWRGITHNKNLQFDPLQVDHFMQVIGEAGNRKGCLLIQFPASTRADGLPTLLELIDRVRRNDPAQQWKLSVEFRHLSWYSDAIVAALTRLQATVVTHDISPSATPFTDSSPGWAYIRFHGPEKGYRGSYSDEALRGHASTVQTLLRAGKSVFIYFNNTLGNAIGNLQTLRALIAESRQSGDTQAPGVIG